MKVERRGVIAFYGCFMRNGTQVTGIFEDESELDVTIRTYYGGEVLLIPLAEQECETAPSTAPTNFPTGKSALVLFYLVIVCVQYEVLVF